ncbi:MAG TPA: HlyD family efflux transporter periplasmic adaptor subunit [Terriglobales bacterium]|nr:HlyD family efflux transporter periplasmic adaptor subunit [Terriglobales bacterium]
MNIIEALDAALPELPETIARRSLPRLDPRVISKEHIEQGQPVVLAKMPGSDNYVRLPVSQWQLLRLFNGERSFADVAQLSLSQTGVQFSEEGVREFVSFLMDNTDLFYKTPLEKNITLQQKLKSRRQKRRRFRFKDIADIQIHEWPHADNYITRLYPYVKFMWTPWFVLLSIGMFAVMFWMWADRFGEIWRDSFQFYNFTSKSFTDLIEFWFLFGAMAFFHESFHGLTCKHFGGNVEKMGFMLMYFAPTFFCDVTQIWIYGGRKARMATVAAGLWGDLIICFFATLIWWTTAPGMWAHDFAYKVMMVTGIGVTLLNLNPLIKIDGYYLFSEAIGEVDLKERSTAYLSGWVRKHVFALPVEIEFVPRRRRAFYMIYAFLSGLYGYLLLFVVVAFTYHVLHAYTPEWAFLPAGILALLVYKSRLRTFGRFMKVVYLDKKERVLSWFTPARIAVITALALLLLFLPVWPDFVEGPFVLEPVQRAVLRAEVRGAVTEVLADEGQLVTAGAPLVRMRNFDLESEAARAHADLQVASSRATQSQLRYTGFGPAEQERQRLADQNRTLADEIRRLQVNSPISGVVTTPDVHDLIGTYLDEGAPILEIGDFSHMLARIYVPEFSMRDVRLGAEVRLRPQSWVEPITGRLQSLAPASTLIEAGLIARDQLKGINPPQYYVGTVLLDNPGDLRDGMSGTAKIYVQRRSLAGFAWRFTSDLVQRRIW